MQRPDFTPLYFRIEESLRRRIASGELGEGDRVPSETELARAFDTTRVTVRQGLTRLVYDGLIVRHSGRGTFVARKRLESTLETAVTKGFEEQMALRGARLGYRLLAFAAVPAPVEITDTLALDPDTPVFRLERLRLVDDEVVSHELRWIRPDLGKRIPQGALESRSAFQLMEDVCGVPIASVDVTVCAATAHGRLARQLGVSRHTPILVREHVFRDASHQPMLRGDATYRGDRYLVSYTIRRAPGDAASPGASEGIDPAMERR